MTDLSPIAATLLTNFTTIRLPRCERLWEWPVADPSPSLRARLLQTALAGETLIGSCHRLSVRGHLLKHGHRAFFDRVEGGEPDGWRLHFFCYEPAQVVLLHEIPIGQCGPGDAVSFDAAKFVMGRLRHMERLGQLGTPENWWDLFDE